MGLRAATFALYQNETLLELEEPNPTNTRVEHHTSGSLPRFGSVCPACSTGAPPRPAGPVPPGTSPHRTRCSGAMRAGQRGAHPAHAAGSVPSQGHAAPPPGWSRLRNWEALMDTAPEGAGVGGKGLGWGGSSRHTTWGTRPVGHGGSLPQFSTRPALEHRTAPKLGLPG